MPVAHGTDVCHELLNNAAMVRSRPVTVGDLFHGAALQRRGSADLIAADMRGRIVAGDLVAGDALREAELAEAFGVARNTVREALRLLTQAGLASYEMHHGVTVRRHTPAEVAAIFEVRAILEAAAARRAGTVGEGEAAPLRRAIEASEHAAAPATSRPCTPRTSTSTARSSTSRATPSSTTCSPGCWPSCG